MSDSNFGWELLYKTAESSFTNKSDVLITFVHFFLIKNKFKCVGIGDDKTISDEDRNNQSELLPEGWNQMDGVYKLRYLCDEKMFVMIATPCDELVILNLIDAGSQKVSNCTLPVEETVVFKAHSASGAVKNFNETFSKLNVELLEPIFKGTQKTIQTQTETKEARPQPNPVVDIRRGIPNPLRDPRFPDVGRGDLDPFGIGPGSIFPGPGIGPQPGIPNPLGVPPGARFDPFGPPPRNRFEPNPDHFRPPGYDDMFM